MAVIGSALAYAGLAEAFGSSTDPAPMSEKLGRAPVKDRQRS